MGVAVFQKFSRSEVYCAFSRLESETYRCIRANGTLPYAPDHLTLMIDDEEIDTARYGIWTWHPQHYAGLYRLIVRMSALVVTYHR